MRIKRTILSVLLAFAATTLTGGVIAQQPFSQGPGSWNQAGYAVAANQMSGGPMGMSAAYAMPNHLQGQGAQSMTPPPMVLAPQYSPVATSSAAVQNAPGCASCGGGGCDACGGGGFGFGGYGPNSTPLNAGGKCAPEWFDVHAQWTYFKRDNVSSLQNFASTGIAGPIALSTDDLDFSQRSGFRVTGALVVGATSSLEASYLGTYDWSSTARVTSGTDNLYSIFSDYGVNPANGYQETDQADLQQIDYNSDLHNVELNWRHRWASDNCFWHGSYLLGGRWLRLDESFTYLTNSSAAPAGSLNYDVSTLNDLVGFQLGGDLWAALSPRLRIGGEAEIGLYGNQAQQDTLITATTLSPALSESEGTADISVVAEAGAMATFRVTPRVTLRGGYQVLWINGVALAPENFNSSTPFAARTVTIDDNGQVFYHGATAGIEWIW